MKILIVGEYSGFSKNLKLGFTQLGHQVSVVSSGDGYKKIALNDGDILLRKERAYYLFGKPIIFTKSITSFLFSLMVNSKILLNGDKYDLIFIINCEFVNLSFFDKAAVNYTLLKKKLASNGKLFLSACGDDTAYYNFHDSSPHSAIVINGAKMLPYINNANYEETFNKVLNDVDLVVPIVFDYYKYMKLYIEKMNFKTTLSKPIFLPYFLPEIPILSKSTEEIYKIKILYGIPNSKNKQKFKGSNYILKALAEIQVRHKDLVEVNIIEGLSFSEYEKHLRSCHILLDQCFGYGFGVNAIMGLSYGKVVFGGNRKENRDAFGIEEIPLIDLTHNVDQIIFDLERIIFDKSLLIKISNDARKFAEKHIACDVVAVKYLELLK